MSINLETALLLGSPHLWRDVYTNDSAKRNAFYRRMQFFKIVNMAYGDMGIVSVEEVIRDVENKGTLVGFDYEKPEMQKLIADFFPWRTSGNYLKPSDEDVEHAARIKDRTKDKILKSLKIRRDGIFNQAKRHGNHTGEFASSGELIRLLNCTGWKCCYCHREITVGLPHTPEYMANTMSIDHIIPRSSSDGFDSIENMLPSCVICNGEKSSVEFVEWLNMRDLEILSYINYHNEILKMVYMKYSL